jgi:serine/threonine protein kinase
MISDQKPQMSIVSWMVHDKTKRGLFSMSGCNDFYYAETSTPSGLAQDMDAWQWDNPPRHIDFTQVYPRYEPSSMTIAKRGGLEFVKKLDLLVLGPRLFDSSSVAMVTSREIQIGEMLLKHPHPNLCVYRGVIVNSDNLVSGLVFNRHDWTLADLVNNRQSFDGKACIHAVEKGLKHLHSLGYIHYDLKPENIFYNVNDKQFVLGDFDASQRIGAKLDLKHGAEGWRPAITVRDDIADPRCDWYGVKVLKFWLKKKGNGKAKKGEKLEGTKDILIEVTGILEK